MKNLPLVSIITCFLNQEKFIKETIISVLNQNYKNWELILIDDGSTDRSTDIAQNYAKDYPEKIKYLDHYNHQNKGLSASRNFGIKASKGELLAFLDGDDVWLSSCLASLVKLMQDHNVAMVSEASKYWYSWDKKPINNDKIVLVGTDQNRIISPPQLIFDLYPLGEGSAPCPCGLLIKKDILEKHRGFDEYFKGMYEDQALLVKLYLYEKVYISSNCNNLYRQRSGSLVDLSHKSGIYSSDRLNFLKWLDKFLIENNINNKLIKRYLRKAYYPLLYPKLYNIHSVVSRRAFQIKEKIKNLLRNLNLNE